MSEKALITVAIVLCAVITGLLFSPPGGRGGEPFLSPGPLRSIAHAHESQEATWQDQLIYLGYLLYRTSRRPRLRADWGEESRYLREGTAHNAGILPAHARLE
jgi:hypothetical protein